MKTGNRIINNNFGMNRKKNNSNVIYVVNCHMYVNSNSTSIALKLLYEIKKSTNKIPLKQNITLNIWPQTWMFTNSKSTGIHWRLQKIANFLIVDF